MAFCLHKKHIVCLYTMKYRLVIPKILGITCLAKLVLAFQASRPVYVQWPLPPACRECCYWSSTPSLGQGSCRSHGSHHGPPPLLSSPLPLSSFSLGIFEETSWLCRELPCATPVKSGACLCLQTESCALGMVFTVRDQHIFHFLKGPCTNKKMLLHRLYSDKELELADWQVCRRIMGEKTPIQSGASNGCEESVSWQTMEKWGKNDPKKSVWNVKEWGENCMCHVNLYTS